MKLNIMQLAKISRRIPRVARKATKMLTGGKKLTPAQFLYWQNKLAWTVAASGLLARELRNRRIGQTAIRCALPLKVQRAIEAAALGGDQLGNRLIEGKTLAGWSRA